VLSYDILYLELRWYITDLRGERKQDLINEREVMPMEVIVMR